ncbi:MAG: glycosyltransferase WbpL [Gammaproteobacteria bacterium]|nr:glycosyltransferase WbpL [Gammaproteobacteria bacterium]
MTPTPRGGGLAVVLAFMGAVAFLVSAGFLQRNLAFVLAAGGGAVALTGYLDDRKTLPASIRICVHIIAAILAVMVLGGITEQTLRNMGLHGAWAGGLLGLMALTWSTNLFNFMDGIDGMAGSEAVFVAAAGALLNWRYGGDSGLTAAMLVLAAATLGFLIWNWPPASIFMGDVGSGFLGFTLGVLGLAASRYSVARIEVWVILNGVFIVDATVTLLTRIMRGDRWFEAHRQHAYQKLASRWKAHLPVTVLVITINLIWLFPWAWIAVLYPARALLCAIAALFPLIVFTSLFGAGRQSRH